jgi:hypothetical protein
VYSQVPEKQYFICDGYKLEGQLPTNSKKKMEEVEVVRKVNESMVFQRVQKLVSKPKLTDPRGYLTFSNEILEVCWEDQINLGLVKNCDLTNVTIHKQSHHTGTMDKITGKLFFHGQYEINDIFYWKDYNLECKRVDSPIVR